MADGKKTLFITSRNTQLLRQTYFRDVKKELPLFPNSICLSSDFPISQRNENEIINHIQTNDIKVAFTSLQTILSKKKQVLKDFLIEYFDLFIIDEIHNFIKNKGNEYIDKINQKDKDCCIFGMTATPFQGIVGNLKFVEEIAYNMREIYHKTISECIVNEQLSPLIYSIIRNNMDISMIFDLGENLSGLDSTELYLDWNNLEQIIERTKLAKQIYDNKVDHNSKTLIFCAPVKNVIQYINDDQKKVQSFHAKLCAAIFNNEIESNFNPEISLKNKNQDGTFKRAVYLSSDLKKNEIKKIIKNFKAPNKSPYILCTVGMLVEGFDFPRLKNLIILRPTLSMRLFEQQVGRILRKHEKKNVGYIYEIVESVDIDSLYEKFSDLIFSDKKLKKILMLNPEHRIENLFLQKSNDLEAFNNNLVQVKEYISNKIDVETIRFNKFDKDFKELIMQIPPLDFRVKIFLKTLEKINLCTEGQVFFRKNLPILLNLATKIRVLNVNEFKQVIKILPLIESMIDFVIEDPNHSQNAKKHKPEMLKEVFWFIKLKILTEMEKLHLLSKKDKRTIIKLMKFKNSRDKISTLKEICLMKGIARRPEELLNDIKKSINFLTGQLQKSSFLKGIKKYENRIKRQIKSKLIWAETYFSDKPDLIYKNFKDGYSLKEIKFGLI